MSCADKEQYKKLVDILSTAKSRIEDVVNGLEPRSHLEEPLEDMTFFLENNPEIQKHFVASLGHITHLDAQLLDKANTSSGLISADKFRFGWRVFVSALDDFDDEAREGEEEAERTAFKKEGYSENFIKLYFMTRRLGCTFLCLDCDGEIYHGLDTYEWDE